MLYESYLKKGVKKNIFKFYSNNNSVQVMPSLLSSVSRSALGTLIVLITTSDWVLMCQALGEHFIHIISFSSQTCVDVSVSVSWMRKLKLGTLKQFSFIHTAGKQQNQDCQDQILLYSTFLSVHVVPPHHFPLHRDGKQFSIVSKFPFSSVSYILVIFLLCFRLKTKKIVKNLREKSRKQNP